MWPQAAEDARRGRTRRQVLRALAASAGPTLLSETGVTRPVGADGSATGDDITEEVWVETGTDTDGTGRSDRVHVEITRPSSSGPDEQVPVVFRPDPYRLPHFGRAREVPELPGYPDSEDAVTANAVELYVPGESEETAGATVAGDTGGYRPGPSGGASLLSSAAVDGQSPYEAELVGEGYAFGYIAPVGSSRSTGCNKLGGPAEVTSVAAVVDWVNGRATAYDARGGGDPVEASWTDGTTGLFGESYRGALANAVATTGVDGLETIVSMRAISSWYTYVRSKGAAISPGNEGPSAWVNLAQLSQLVTTRPDADAHCADVIGDMAERTDRETGNYNDFWAARDYVPDADGIDASVLLVHGLYDEETRPREFSQWLAALKAHDVPYGVWLHQAGHDDPIDRHEDAWLDRLLAWYDHWLKGEDSGILDEPPVMVEREDESLTDHADWPAPDAEHVPLAPGPGPSGNGTAIGRLGFEPPAEPTTESLVDNSDIAPEQFLGESHAEHRLVYRTPPLESAVRVSGTVQSHLRLSFDSAAALVSGALVDYAGSEDSEAATIVNRGWMNPLNRDSLRESTPLEPGVAYDLQLPLQPVDYVFEPGHSVGFVLYSSDYDVTKRPPSSPELTLHLRESTVEVPVVGGRDELRTSFADDWDGGGGGDEGTGSDDGRGGQGGNGNRSDGGGSDSGDGDDSGEHSDGGGDGSNGGADGAGPGLGIANGVAGLGGVGYLLWRRREAGSDGE